MYCISFTFAPMHLQFQHRFACHQGSVYALVKGQGEGVFYSGAGVYCLQ